MELFPARDLMLRPQRALPLIVVVAVVLVLVVLGRQQRPPDVILIVLDTTRADALSCYGQARTTTPHIDALAEGGVLFLEATSPSPWTCPSVASIFTGLLPSQHGLHLEHIGLRSRHLTIAEVMAKAGYQTAAFSNNPFISSSLGLGQGFEYFKEVWRDISPEQLRSDDPGGRFTNRLVAEWLDSERDPSRPLFLMVHYMEPHLPYHPPDPFARAFTADDVDESMVRGIKQMPLLSELGYIVGEYSLSVEQLAVLEALYHADVAYTDQLVGELLNELREHSLLGSSMLILTSDHGENLGEHHMLDHKFCVYETLLKVPLVVRYPPVVPAGQRVTEPVQTTDLFATIAEVAGVEPPDGSRRGPSLFGPRSPDRAVHGQYYRPSLFMDALRSAYPEADVSRLDRRLSSVAVDGMKYIWSSDGAHELYDLQADSQEESNLAATRPEVMEALEKQRIKLR